MKEYEELKEALAQNEQEDFINNENAIVCAKKIGGKMSIEIDGRAVYTANMVVNLVEQQLKCLNSSEVSPLLEAFKVALLQEIIEGE